MDREKMALILEGAAHSIREGKGHLFDFVSITPDSIEIWGAPPEAEEEATHWTEPDGEWPEEMENTCWGIFVRMQSVVRTDYEETPDDDSEYDYTCKYVLTDVPVRGLPCCEHAEVLGPHFHSRYGRLIFRGTSSEDLERQMAPAMKLGYRVFGMPRHENPTAAVLECVMVKEAG